MLDAGPEGKKLRHLVNRMVSSGEVSASEAPATVVAKLVKRHQEYARKSQAALRGAVQEVLSGGGGPPATPVAPSLNDGLRSAYAASKRARAPALVQDDDEDDLVRLARRAKPDARMVDLAGADAALRIARESVLEPLSHAELYEGIGVEGPRGLLVHGPTGCGKSLLCRAVAGEANDDVSYFEVSGAELVERDVRRLFRAAVENEPSIVFLDDLDAVVGTGRGSSDGPRRAAATLGDCLDGLAGSKVFVLGAATAAEAIDGRLRRFGRFEREIALGAPNVAGRTAILDLRLAHVTTCRDVNVTTVARATPGWVGADLAALVAHAGASAVRRCVANPEACLAISAVDLSEARAALQPSFARSGGFATPPAVSWTDVGALADVRDALAKSILAPIADPAKFERLGLPLPAGVLLYGPPGCGKTLLAKALATESNANFIAVKGPELLDKYVGESERAVRGLFSRARASAPCIVFFDEVDALCPARSSHGRLGASQDGAGNSAVTDRIVNQLLTELDGLDARGQVYVVAATNRPELLDKALLRPGRVDKLLYVPLPDATDRAAILRALTHKVRLDARVDLDSLACDDRAHGFSGADLAALVREAGLAALDDGDQAALRHQDFDSALDRLAPSVSATDAQAYADLATRMTPSRSSPALIARNNKRPRLSVNDELDGDNPVTRQQCRDSDDAAESATGGGSNHPRVRL